MSDDNRRAGETITPEERIRWRTDQDAAVRIGRHRAAIEALDACAVTTLAQIDHPDPLGEQFAIGARLLRAADPAPRALLGRIADHVREARTLLADGRNEPRYAATGAALEALGRLWAVSS